MVLSAAWFAIFAVPTGWRQSQQECGNWALSFPSETRAHLFNGQAGGTRASLFRQRSWTAVARIALNGVMKGFVSIREREDHEPRSFRGSEVTPPIDDERARSPCAWPHRRVERGVSGAAATFLCSLSPGVDSSTRSLAGFRPPPMRRPALGWNGGSRTGTSPLALWESRIDVIPLQIATGIRGVAGIAGPTHHVEP